MRYEDGNDVKNKETVLLMHNLEIEEQGCAVKQ